MELIDKVAGLERLSLANLPTPIQRLDRISSELGKGIWIKRDDLTGGETSGNKIRKLEYTLARALKEGADVVITAGGIQSNHARATAAAAARLGLKSHLVLDISKEPSLEGNYLLDKILGAEISLLNEKEEGKDLDKKMQEIAESYRQQGKRPYIIPVGASDGIGNFGYVRCAGEIEQQENRLGVKFDAIVCATGSGGTYSGLYIGNKIYGLNKKIVGFTVCDNKDYFQRKCSSIVDETMSILGADTIEKVFSFIDGYKGRGYAISKEDELKFISKVARTEGVILDPVYTGKAFYGLYQEIQKGHFDDCENILFIHTGGLCGLFPKQEQFAEFLL
ncbi:MAG: D-cysteine desulfhydrase family protein [Butyrivibrio sp.]|nr:D-cysteine desulfhydrase family protein [Butyrivibrio sp.]MBR1643577.1 D-cysteine desulfhydrase family protein [Butyrivibrio sp.]